MSEFQELIKSLAKSRNYVRDFLIYGFKSRDDFSAKSGRTYDNERRRVACWLSGYIQSDYGSQGKTVSLAMDSSLLGVNPLYRVWKAKSFTDNDIVLHFLCLDLFRTGGSYTADEMADRFLEDYQLLFETQLVRKKANEYVKEGILISRREGRKLLYSIVPGVGESLADIFPGLLDAVRFCQLSMPLGVVGSMILDQSQTDNEIFMVKHGYYGFTLEDEMLFLLLHAIREKCFVTLINRTNKMAKDESIRIVPLKIFVSTRTGRRFLCGYHTKRKRFSTLRLDHIQSIKVQEPFNGYDFYQEKLAKNIPRCFGVSFGSSHARDTVRLTLKVLEGAEDYILRRLEREGHGGRITRTEENIYTYELSVFDGNEMMPWIKTFIGRIVRFESNNEYLVKKFYGDIRAMAKMYEIQESI